MNMQTCHKGRTRHLFAWRSLRYYIFFILPGALATALSLRIFLIPGKLVSGGISGAAQILEYYTNWPIGLMIFLGNLPLFILGYRYLGGLRFSLRTAAAIIAISLFTDALAPFFPPEGITDDPFLNALYGGVLLGIGLGLIYRGQGTSGGSDILSRILNVRLGMSISTSYIIADVLVVLGGCLAFGWELGLYGMVAIYVSGLAAEMVSEGSSVFRAVMIISTQPKEVADRILEIMERGVTVLSATGAYTGEARPVLYCVITRAEVHRLKLLVYEVDPKAFMVIGQATEALGEGFRPFHDTP